MTVSAKLTSVAVVTKFGNKLRKRPALVAEQQKTSGPRTTLDETQRAVTNFSFEDEWLTRLDLRSAP